MSSSEKIRDTLENLNSFLQEKNRRYGDSALNPIEVFTGKTNKQGIGVRLDDKLSRIKNSKELRKNDVTDVIGYLVLLCIDNNWNSFTDLVD